MMFEDTAIEDDQITYRNYNGLKIVTDRPSRNDLAVKAERLASQLTKLARNFQSMHYHGDSITMRDDARHIEMDLTDLVEILDACIRPEDYDY